VDEVKKRLVLTVAAVTVALAVVAVDTAVSAKPQAKPPNTVRFPWGTFKLSPKIQAKLAGKEPLNYVLSIEGTGIPIFGAAMKAGWDRGGKAESKTHPISSRVIGPVNTDVPTQVSQISSLLNSGQIDCLAFEAHEPGPYIDVVNKAVSQGIPVFAVNADSPDSHRFAIFHLNEMAAGIVAGKQTGLLIKKKGLKVQTAALLTGSPEGPWAQSRMKGFVKGLSSVIPGIKWENKPSNAPSTTFDAATVYSTSRSFMTGHPDVQLIFHTDQGVETVAKAINDLKLTGKVWTSGFNLSPAILSEIQKGQILVTVGQGFNKQAEAGSRACSQYLLHGKVLKGDQFLNAIPVTSANAAQMKRSVTQGGA
jgi:ABC-type sugar transport system substrate-binding protein